MDSNHKFFEAMKLVTELSKEQQDRFIREVKSFQRESVFEQLNIGTVVKINHKKISPMDQFRITKINRKNVVVNAGQNGMWNVTASMLIAQ